MFEVLCIVLFFFLIDLEKCNISLKQNCKYPKN